MVLDASYCALGGPVDFGWGVALVEDNDVLWSVGFELAKVEAGEFIGLEITEVVHFKGVAVVAGIVLLDSLVVLGPDLEACIIFLMRVFFLILEHPFVEVSHVLVN